MAEKPKYFDYEPVTRPRRRTVEEVGDDVERGFVPASSIDGPFASPALQKGNKTETNEWRLAAQSTEEKPQSQTATHSVLRKGHALSFAGIFLFSFVVYFRPYEWTPALGWLSSSAFWIAIATIAVFIPTQLGLEGNLTARPREVKLILLLTGLALLSIPFSLSPSSGLIAFLDYVKVILIFVVMVNVVRTDLRLKTLLVLSFVASCILSLLALNDYRSGNLTLQGTRISGWIGGIFSNPNDLALHLVTMVPLAVCLLLGTRSIIKKSFYAICSILFVAGIVATFSRGGVLGLVVAGFVLAGKYSHKMRFVMVGAFVILLLGLLAVSPGGFRERLFTTNDASAVSRTDDLKRSIFLSVRHPLLGIGLGNYVFYSNQAKATHNAYTQISSELGLAAATCYVLFLIAPLKPLSRIEKETRGIKAKRQIYYLAIGLQAALIGYMVSSFFASVPYLWYAYYLVAYAIALRRIHDSSGTTPSTGLTDNSVKIAHEIRS